MNRREFLVCAAVLPWSLRSFASAAPETTTAFIEATVRDGIAPGAAIVASRDGAIRFEKAYGTYCSLNERQVRLTLETIHPLYSFSKLITGTVVAMTIQEGRLDYNDPVSKHIPEFTGEGRELVTLRHCLTHSAGLAKAALKPASDEAGWNAALQMLCKYPVEWKPGSKTSYHGWSGAFLAAECVRRASGGKPWTELCRERLFAPLGVKSLSFELPQEDQPLAIVPQPDPSKPMPKSANAALSFAGHPGAGCVGTLVDALKVLHLHLQEGVWNSKPLIARDVFRQMHTVQYASEIQAARAAGKAPAHEPWGLGPLLRGTGPACDAHKWFGFYDQTSSGIFGHAGISTLIGVGDLHSKKALMFATTDSPKPAEQTVTIRNKATNIAFKELA